MKRNLAILFAATLTVGAGLGVACLQATVQQTAGELDQLTKESVRFELEEAHFKEENERIESVARERWNAAVILEGNKVEGEGSEV